jgi:hypothetical protein
MEAGRPMAKVAPETRSIKLADGRMVKLTDEATANLAYAKWMGEQLRAMSRNAMEQQPKAAPVEARCVTTTLMDLPGLFYDSSTAQIRSSETAVVSTTGALCSSLYPSVEHDQTPLDVLAMMARSHVSLLPKAELGADQVWSPKPRDLIAAERDRLDAMQTQTDMAILRNAHDRMAAEQARRVAIAGQRAQQQIAQDQLAFARRQADADRREREAYRKQQMEGGPRMNIADYGEFNAPNTDDLDFFGRPKKRGR